MAKSKKSEKKEDSILENPDVLVSKTEQFFKDKKKRNLTTIIGSVLLLVIIGLFFYRSYLGSRNDQAQEDMFLPQRHFEQDSLTLALNGDGVNYGFLAIISEYSGTEAANLSHFYAGACYLQLGDYNSAIRYLKDFSSSDYLVQGRAYALIGDAYMELEDYEEAADYYEEAADYKPNKEYTPLYLIKLAVAQENAGNYSDAAEAYNKIIKDYRENPVRGSGSPEAKS